MMIQGYGLELQQLQQQDLEMVRLWRNSPHVRNMLANPQIISPEAQQTWFAQLDSQQHLYFVARQNDVPFGVFYLTNINQGTAAPGAFIGDTEFLETPVPAIGILVLLQFGFEHLKLEKLSSLVKDDNKRGLGIYPQLGFVPEPANDPPGFTTYSCTATDFEMAATRFKQIAATYAHTTQEVQVTA